MLQVFESNCGYLTPHLFDKFCRDRLTRIVTEVKKRLGDKAVPMTIFCKDGFFALDRLAQTDYDVISIDWATSAAIARERCPGKTLQGNLDPCALYGSKETIEAEVGAMVDQFGNDKYIVNLGHGIYPDMDPEAVQTFIECVHNVKIEPKD